MLRQAFKVTARERDPKTFEENSQGRDPTTLERNSQGVPSALLLKIESWQGEKIRVLEEESTKRKGKGGKTERQREKWCD